MSQENKAVVQRLVVDVFNGGNLDVIDTLFVPGYAAEAREWIAPYRASFPDMHIEIVELIAESETVVGRFTCSATHTGEWMEHLPTGRRFELIDGVAFFYFCEGRVIAAWCIEDNLARLEHLGLCLGEERIHDDDDPDQHD